MLKRILFMMITVFSLMLNSAVMAEEYDYTVFRDVDGVPVAVDNPQSCSTFFDMGQGADITMTPMFRRVCETGYYDRGGLVSLADIENNSDTCALIAKSCYPGEYLDFSGNEPVCKACPVGYWCPSRYLSVETPNESNEVCGNNVAEDGMTEENKSYKWKNNKCIDSETNQEVPGINSESACGFKSIGKCKCPGDTTTRATKQEGFGLHSTSIDACAYYDLGPGEQLKRSVDTEHNYQWENGKCIDKDTNEEVTSIKSSVYCGYTYTKADCDADHFCLGGVFTAAKYENSMNVCPDKYNDVVTLETSSDCATASTNGFTWNTTYKKCFVAGTTIEVKSITTSGACTKANEIKADLVWNTEKQACLLKGHSVPGSFRCSYTCPAGYYMHIVNQYDDDFYSRSVQNYYTSDYFLGGWRAFYTTCEPCPVGSYCLGKTFFLDELHNDTRYHADTYYDKNDASKREQIKYYTNGESVGITNCNKYKANSTTVEVGSYEASQCKSFCPAGQYYNKAAGECKSCVNAGLADDAYCPGNVLYDEHTAEDVGISTCEQQNVVVYESGINNVRDTIYIPADDNTNHYIQPTTDKTACTCPKGYTWNKTTHACCDSNKACCGAGLDLRTYSDDSYECKPCGSGKAEEDTACDLICEVNGKQSSDCTACRNKTWCPGTVLIIDTPCVLGVNQYRGEDKGCHTCGFGGELDGYDEDTQEYTSCKCTVTKMTADMNAGGVEDRFPELKDNPSPGLIRFWNGYACELDTYYVGVRYTNIDLNGSIYKHGQSCGWNEECDYWSQYYKYGQIRNKKGDYVAANSFEIDWKPSELGYNFSNPVTPEEGLANPESMSARKVENGYVFAGWCRETGFCCPAGYKVQDLEDGRKECVICPNGDKTSEACNGSKWLAPDNNNKPSIDTKAEENRIKPKSFKYYAMMVADSVCAKGETLNTTTIKCMDCPAGYYCLGGKLSPRKLEKYPCPKGTYREYTKGTQKEYSYDPEHPGTYDGCKPCDVGVSEELSRISGTNVQVPVINGLKTQQEASKSVDQCGYSCEEGFYDVDGDNDFRCVVECPAGWYCPAAGREPGHTKYKTAFYDWKHQGKGKILCPGGLNSDAGARQCYTDPGCHYEWKDDKCLDIDTKEVILGIASESECVYTGYYKKKNADGDYVCVKCGANDPLTDSYFYCPKLDRKVNVDLIMDTTIHEDSIGRNACTENPVTHIKRISDDDAYECYELPNAGRYTDPETGLPELCNENHFCTGKEENGVLGRQKCPDGSVSNVGAQFITDCQCVSGENYRPDGAYYEKGAELVQYGSTLNDFACVNTYLVVDNTAAYDDAEDSISNAKAKIVSCAWVNNQEHPDENAAPDGKYRNCTEKAVDICYKSVWNNTVIGPNVSVDDPSYVSTSDVVKWLANALYTNTEQQTIGYLVSKLSRVSNVQNIPTIDNWQSCQTSILCMDGFKYYNNIGFCYAEITYREVDDEDITWPEDPENPGEYLTNPEQYTPDMLPFMLHNPEKPHHVFNGWCLAGESSEDCAINTVQLALDEETDEWVTFIGRVIPEETMGDLEFIAQWEMVCPDDYSHHDGKLTDVTQCYAVVEFDSNKVGIANPENHIEQYSEGATTYTLAALPELPSVTGYNFGGWYDNATTTGNVVTSETALSGDNKLYAKWSPITYNVAFDGNGATSGSMLPETFKYDESKALTANTFEKTGWDFVGWCKGSTSCNVGDAEYYADGAVISTNLTSTDNATITMYAKWTPKTYTVKFDGNGADANSGPMADETFDYGERKALFANEFEKTDYVFIGWCKGVTVCNDSDVNFYTDEEEVFNLVSVDAAENTVTMYAQWRAEGCSDAFPIKDTTTGACYANIVYKNTEGATWLNSHNQIITTNPDPQRYNALNLPITLSKPRKDNYIFLGWCENEEMTENCETEKIIALGSTKHKTFWAKWEHSCVSDKYLHIGDTAICLYEEKPTSPALAIKIDGTVYYGHMCKNCNKTMNDGTRSKLHVRYEEETYNVYDLTAR